MRYWNISPEQSRKRLKPTPKQRFGRGASHLEKILGITSQQAAERFVHRYGLASDGTQKTELVGGTAKIRLANGGAQVQWFDAAGNPRKAPPASARQSSAAEIRTIKANVKSINAMLVAQRNRLDSMLRTQHSWPWPDFRTYYLGHPMIGDLARRLIWLSGETPLLFANESAVDVNGAPVPLTPAVPISQWHPARRPPSEVLAWRKRLETLEIIQPFKQAHREVYLLTEAERQTRTYSNRFAAHVLRQHQFAHLARGRGWNYDLLGLWDGGHTGAARFNVPQGNLRAEFWVEPANIEDHSNSPVALHVTTDQIRFFQGDSVEPMPLEQIPPLILSEIMRDVDLFVGVASIGNDATWSDGGPEGRYRNYWHNYSFGSLAETAKTRRDVLERLIPRMKIADRCELEARFLKVRGELRTYRIHLGSGNILMEPNDQYLCIVPARGEAAASGRHELFLPFEGDTTLSVILSKAFLLADDAKIKDPTITRQIVRA